MNRLAALLFIIIMAQAFIVRRNEVSAPLHYRNHDKPCTLRSLALTGQISVNCANKEALVELPGIGEVSAARIIAHREERGPYQKAEDLLAVRGIGPVTLNRLSPYLFWPALSER